MDGSLRYQFGACSSELCLRRQCGFYCARPVPVGTDSALHFPGVQAQRAIVDEENPFTFPFGFLNPSNSFPSISKQRYLLYASLTGLYLLESSNPG